MPSILDQSIIDGLVPVIDTVRRDVHAIAGDRQFDVAVVVRTWPSGRRGDASGGPAVDTVRTLDPRPRVQFGEGLHYEMEAGGKREKGDCRVSEVSLTYTEAELNPKATPAQEVFYRLRDAKGQAIQERLFNLSGPPQTDLEKDIGWVLRLTLRQGCK